jgi:trigger factor
VKTTVERVDDTKIKLSITVEAARVRRALDEAARHLAAEVRIPGFRPGKAPRRVLESRIGKGAIVEHAVNDALPGFYAEAVRAEELTVVGQPEFDVESFEEGSDGAFTATVDVMPEIEAPEYEGLQIPHPEWEVTDEEVDEQLDAMRDRFAELETVKRAVQLGDFVVVTVTGTRDGEPFDEASADDLLYEVKDPETSDQELDRQLLGAESGAILKFSDTLGADYGELAGEEVAFTVIVKDVKAKQLPALDDDFAITASEFDTIDELTGALREQIGDAKLSNARQSLRGRVVEAVTELVDVKLPEALVQQELQWRLQQLASQAERYGLSLDQYVQMAGSNPEELVQQLTDDARKTVKGQLVVDVIGREAGVEIGQQDLGEEIARQSIRLGRPPEELAELFNSPDRIGALYSDAFRRKTIDHLLEHVEVLSAPSEEVLEAAEQRLAAQAEEGERAATAEDAADEPADLVDADEETGDDGEDGGDDGEDSGDDAEGDAEVETAGAETAAAETAAADAADAER